MPSTSTQHGAPWFARTIERATSALAATLAAGMLLACGSGGEPDASTQPVTVTVAPSTATVGLNATLAFGATVSNSSDGAVSWQVNGIAGGNATVGTISNGGVYVAPAAVPSPATVLVSAVSQADTTRSASASVTVVSAPPIGVTVAPASATVLTSATQMFTATVTNTGNTGVNWQVNGIAGGNATVGTIAPNGLYTAPAAVPTPATVTVKAVSVADTTKSGSAIVTVGARPAITVTVSPAAASVAVTATRTFTATVTNTANTAVSWQINGIAGGNATVGTISSGGVYTAPAAVPSPATVSVSAVSQADTTKSASASVTVVSTPPIGVTVAPASATVLTSATQTFTATVSNTGSTAVAWQVNGVNGGNATDGTVAPNGLYTAPASVPTPATVTVKAVSVADTTKSGSASVTVGARPAITVTVSPAAASVAVTSTQTFTATVTNTANTAVSWQVNGIAGGNATVGTVSNGGVYVAPAAVPSPATVSVSAVSVADNTKSGAASVTITSAAAVSVAVSPSRAAITSGQTQQFSASVTGSTDTAVSWAVDGVSGGSTTVGTISSGGLYTPPSTGGAHTVTASSHAAPAQSASATLAVTDLAAIATQRYDAARTGQNLKEYALTPATLATPGAFGKLFSCPVDGVVYAQPLYVANLAIGDGVHNVVFVATMHDSVYAFDADSPACITYWKTSFLGSGVTTVPASDTAETGDIPLEFGVTGTPVIDLAAGALYVVANTKESGPSYPYRLHKLSLGSGAEMANSPKVIQGSAAGVTFAPIDHLQRPGLLLANNTVYVAFGSHGDTSIYYGWVFGYDKTSLAQTGAVFSTAPHPGLSDHGGQAAIWMAGAGPAADAAGNVFFSTGNGTFTATTGTVPPPAANNDFGDSVIKLSGALALTDYFTPSNESSLNAADADLGAGGVMVLPDSVGSTAHPRLAIIGDKESKLFLFDRDAMGHYTSGGPDGNVQTLLVNSSGSGVFTGIFSTPTIWGTTLYIGATNDKVKAYPIGNAQIALSPSSTSSDTYTFPGTNTVVSANGAAGGVLWAIDTNKNGTAGRASGPFILRAYDATNLATRLWSSDAGSADTGGNAAKFAVPTVANGKVYVGGLDGLTVYGLRP